MSDFCINTIKNNDYDRYLLGLFTTKEKRQHFYTLYTFNDEIAKIGETTSEPMTGYIRLQWWRDALASINSKTPKQHPLIPDLAQMIAKCKLPVNEFIELIDAREDEMEPTPFATINTLETYHQQTSSKLLLLVLACFDNIDNNTSNAINHLGIAWGLTQSLRNVPADARRKRVLLPESLLKEADLTIDDVIAGKNLERTPALVKQIVEHIQNHLNEYSKLQLHLKTDLKPITLHHCLIKTYLKKIKKYEYNLYNYPITINPVVKITSLLIG